MTGLRRSALQPLLALVLAIVLSVAAGGRGWSATAVDAPAGLGAIPGVTVQICHTDPAGPNQDDQARHTCCDTCALCAAATLPLPPSVVAADAAQHVVSQAYISVWRPALAQPRSPRLSRGPPDRVS